MSDRLIPHPTIEGVMYDPALVSIPTGDPVADAAYAERAAEQYSFPQRFTIGDKP